METPHYGQEIFAHGKWLITGVDENGPWQLDPCVKPLSRPHQRINIGTLSQKGKTEEVVVKVYPAVPWMELDNEYWDQITWLKQLGPKRGLIGLKGGWILPTTFVSYILYVQELGQELVPLLLTQTLPLSTKISFAQDILQGVQTLREKLDGYLLDIKLDNVVVVNGEAKLCDLETLYLFSEADNDPLAPFFTPSGNVLVPHTLDYIEPNSFANLQAKIAKRAPLQEICTLIEKEIVYHLGEAFFRLFALRRSKEVGLSYLNKQNLPKPLIYLISWMLSKEALQRPSLSKVIELLALDNALGST